MTIKYNKKIIWKELVLGSLFFILGIYFAVNEPDNILRYGFILLGAIHLTSGIYQLRMPYLKLENGSITRGGFISRSIAISEVERIRKFGGDYTLFTSGKKLKINSESVNKAALNELDGLMRSLEIPLDETPPEKYKYT